MGALNMIAFLKTCLYLFIIYWILDETGPVTGFLFVLMVVEAAINADKVQTLSAAYHNGVTTADYKLRKSLNMHDVGRE